MARSPSAMRHATPQLPLSFARPPKTRTRGGLAIADYRELVDRLRADATRVAVEFRLPPFELDADSPDAADRYGICFDDGRIRVRLNHIRTGRALRYSALIDTVVHELAHLRHMNHGPRWEALYEKMLAWCRREGIYAPQPRRSSPPASLSLGAATPPAGRPASCEDPQLALFSARR